MKLGLRNLGVHGLLLLMCITWGASNVFVKIALVELAPMPLAFLRLIVASAAMIAFLATVREPMPRVSREHVLPLILAGVTGVVGYQLLVTWGLVYINASTAGVLNSVGPVATLLLGSVMLREPLTRQNVTGITVSAIGVTVVVLWGAGEAKLDFSHLVGPLLVSGALVSWALCSMFQKPLLRKYSTLWVTSVTIILGTVMLLPAGLTLGLDTLFSLSWGTWGAILFLGIVASGGGQLLYTYGLSKLDASQVAAYMYLLPFISMATGAAMLGEVITIYLFLGGILIIAGIIVANRSPRRTIQPNVSQSHEPAAPSA